MIREVKEEIDIIIDQIDLELIHVMNRKMSNNERALVKFQEQDRQERIKHLLKRYEKRERDEMWRGKKFNPAFAPNIMKDNDNIFKGQKKLF